MYVLVYRIKCPTYLPAGSMTPYESEEKMILLENMYLKEPIGCVYPLQPIVCASAVVA